MELPLTLQLRPSRGLRLVLVCAHVVMALTLLLASPGWLLSVLVLYSLAVSLYFFLRRPAFELTAAVTGLVLLRDGNLILLNSNNGVDSAEVGSAKVAASTAIYTWLVVLNLKTGDGRKISLILPTDALVGDSSNAHRQLRLWLLNSPQSSSNRRSAAV